MELSMECNHGLSVSPSPPPPPSVESEAKYIKKHSNNRHHSMHCCKQPPILLLLFFIITIIHYILILVVNVTECVVVDKVSFIVKSNRPYTNYAFTGEPGILFCHFLMGKEDEEIRQITWTKDGEYIFRETKGVPGLEILSATFKGAIESESEGHTIHIKQMTIRMHGKYTCKIKTDIDMSKNDVDVIVIRPNACSDKNWTTSPSEQQCKEVIQLHCTGMFPKPVPSCGLWDQRIHKFIKSVLVHVYEEQGTYTVSYSQMFKITDRSENFYKYNGRISFKCDLSVPNTNYKISKEYPLFDYKDGCFDDPLDYIEELRSNYSRRVSSIIMTKGLINTQSDIEILSSSLSYRLEGPRNCWKRPKHQSLARISCLNTETELSGINVLECTKHGWRLPVQSKANIPLVFEETENSNQVLREKPYKHLDILPSPGQNLNYPLASDNYSFSKGIDNNVINRSSNLETNLDKYAPLLPIDVSLLPTCLSKIPVRSSSLNDGPSSQDNSAGQSNKNGSLGSFYAKYSTITGIYFLAMINSAIYLLFIFFRLDSVI